MRKEFLPIRAQLLTAKYGSPAYSDQGYKRILLFVLFKSNILIMLFLIALGIMNSLNCVIIHFFKNHFAGALGVDPLV